MTSEEAEELYPPRPGGHVDTARKARAAREEQAQAQPVGQGPARAGEYQPARVDVVVPDVLSARTFVVSTSLNPVLRLLGFDKRRRRAIVMTLDEPVVISASQAAASDPQNAVNAAGTGASGFVLPAGIPLTIDSRAEVWVAATSSTPTRVSVLADTFGE